MTKEEILQKLTFDLERVDINTPRESMGKKRSARQNISDIAKRANHPFEN